MYINRFEVAEYACLCRYTAGIGIFVSIYFQGEECVSARDEPRSSELDRTSDKS